ncbi:SODC-like protein [Mya arenaria]|uniref:Superoxide dismutase [Cu-Zn] n=1 Tax=Mya arenaria TaxID=6604 RepID=A0ABY7EEB8_MYAAR|nr:superoxide dismutase [Cu-Zn]-like [Mya arenaria]WAR07514.1 SODC-like protein [Mya arenaria]
MAVWRGFECLFIFVSLFALCCGQWGWRLPPGYACVERPVQAICRLRPNPTLMSSEYRDIQGIVIFTQRITCFGHYSLQVKINIAGLPANGTWDYHGIHVHESGDMSRGCESMGPHYNPYGTAHGSPRDPESRRHVGDFGNVVKDPFGNIQGALFDNIASLVGRTSILRRGVVLHEMQDDLGRGINRESLRTGNAGRRLACCVIEPL